MDLWSRPEVVDEFVRKRDLFPAEESLLRRCVSGESDVLDLGIGAGRTAGPLLEAARSYVGIDLSPEMIEQARRRFPDADLRVGDASDLSLFEDSRFDVVLFSFNGLDYLAEAARARALVEFHRVLRPGGTLVYSSHCPRAVLRPVRTEGDPVDPRAWWTAARISARRVAMLGLSGAFRRGVGVARDPGYHGTPAYMVTPPRARAELAAAGFELRDVCSKSGVRATRRSVLWTSWYYYRAVRPTE